MIKKIKQSFLIGEISQIEIIPFRKKLLFIILFAVLSNGAGLLFLTYSKKIGSWELYLLSMLILLFANVFYSFKYSFLISQRFKNINPELKNGQILVLDVLTLFPWAGIYLIYLLSATPKAEKGFFLKRLGVFFIISTIIFTSYRTLSPDKFNQNEGRAKKVNFIYNLAYDNSMYSLRFALNVLRETSHLFENNSCSNQDKLRSETEKIDWDCFTNQMIQDASLAPKKTQTFYILGVAFDARRLFGLKKEASALVTDAAQKEYGSNFVALKLIESQITYFNLIQNRANPLDYSFPFLIYLKGHIEGILFYIVEELLEYRFETTMLSKIDALNEKVINKLKTGPQLLSAEDHDFFLKKALEYQKALTLIKDQSFLKMHFSFL